MARAQRHPILESLLLACAVATGCKGDDPATATTGASAGSTAGTTPTSTPTDTKPSFDRLAPREMVAFGAQDGFVDGGMIHAALRPITVLTWLRTIPLPGEAARELAELSEATGVDWRAENIERRFALAPGAVLSMSLFRPIMTDASELRGELTRGGAVLDALAAAMGKEPTADRGKVFEDKPAEIAAEAPMVAPPVAVEIEPPKPSGPLLTPAELEWGKKLLEIASALGLHSRLSLQVTEARPILEHIRGRVPHGATLRWAKVCAAIPGAMCIGEDDVVAVIRSTERAITLDVLMFAARAPDVTEAQRKMVLDAVGVPATTADLGLRGDGAMAVDAASMVRFVELDALRRGVSTLRWGGPERETEIRENLDNAKAFAELANAPQLFTGARVGAVIDGENLHAELRWLLVPGQADNSAKVFTAAASTASIPAIPGLCDGALFCFRTGGLVRPSILAEQLGVGAWALGPEAAERNAGKFDEVLYIHAFVASWPNFLGSAARLPALELGGGPEGMVASNVLDMLGRVQSTGGSLRAATVSHRRVSADYAVYARTTASDAAIPRAMLGLAGQSMRDVTLPGAGGPASEFTVPEDDFPATVISRPDPTMAGIPSTNGWIAVVDAPDRMSWLLALPMEAHSGPAVYAEIPDLGRLASTIPDLARELESMQSALDRRSLRASLELDSGEPLLRASLTRTP